MNYSELKYRAIAVKSSLEVLDRSYRDHCNEYNKTEKVYKDCSHTVSVLNDAIDKMKIIIEVFSSTHIKEIEDLVTYGLRTIFYDRNYSFSIEVTDKRNNKYAEFFLKEDTPTGEIVVPLRKSNVAGGILVIVGFILQAYYVSYFKASPVIITDESFSQVSDEYLPGLFTFIDRLKEQKKFIIILVTHDTRFLEYADKTYLADKGKFIEVKKNG